MLTIATYRTIPNCGSTVLCAAIGTAAWKFRSHALVVDGARLSETGRATNPTISQLRKEMQLPFDLIEAVNGEDLASCHATALAGGYDLVIFDLPSADATEAVGKAGIPALHYTPFRSLKQLHQISCDRSWKEPKPNRFIPVGFENYKASRLEIMDFGPLMSTCGLTLYPDIEATLSGEDLDTVAEHIWLWREIVDLAEPAKWGSGTSLTSSM